jgi:hypothetical protein
MACQALLLIIYNVSCQQYALKMAIIPIITAVIIIILPTDALAWGGGTHLQVGLHLLANLSQLPPAVAMILSRAPNDFLYGCLAADIIVGKKFTHYLLNCHRWSVGQRVLSSASTDAEKACAYGYLCHLAADVVAHNYFVPFKTMRSFATVALRHTYWEMRFESFLDKSIWDRAREVCRAGRPLDDALLRRVVTPTLFSFGTNKQIFNSIMLLSRLERWQTLIQIHSAVSRHSLTSADRDEYLRITNEVALDLLKDGDSAFCLTADPTGEMALSTSQEIRQHMRFLYKAGHITKEDGIQKIDELKPLLLQAVHKPELLESLRDFCHQHSTPFDPAT